MLHHTPLIATIAVAFVLALTFGFVAARLRAPPLVGYLLAGIALGPFTPGLVADASLAAQLADVGVILLMFGVGLHFSPADLLKMRRVIEVPGSSRGDLMLVEPSVTSITISLRSADER